MTNIFILPDDVLLYILQFLDTKDTICFGYTCQRFRQICLNGRVFGKVVLSRCSVIRRQQGAIEEFLRDEEMMHQIRELNLSNDRAINWQMDDQLEKFIISICPHLEALHVLNCGLSLCRLQRILQQAPNLTALSWSFFDLVPEDSDFFLVKSIESCSAVSLANIKHLHFEIFELKPHIQVLKYLVLCCCKYLEELEVYVWQLNSTQLQSRIQAMKELSSLAIHQPSMCITDQLQHLHSLTVLGSGKSSHSCFYPAHRFNSSTLSDFIYEVVRKKSREVKWKKFWVSAPMHGNTLPDMFNEISSSAPLPEDHQHELHSVKSFAAHSGRSQHAWDDWRALFQCINDNTVRILHVCVCCNSVLSEAHSVLELCEPVLRTGGEALEFLSLSLKGTGVFLRAQANAAFNTLFSVCSNIRELDVVECHFEKDICGALSTLKHVLKIQLQQCAIFSKQDQNQQDKRNESLQTFIRNCQDIKEFEIHGCHHWNNHLSSRWIVDKDLLPLTKLRKLESFTLAHISYNGKWASLKTMAENCEFLSTLRIWIMYNKLYCDIPIFQAAKFLKHLAINIMGLDLGSEDVWKYLSCAKSLERLCLNMQSYQGYLNVDGAIKMLKSLHQLHVFHIHISRAENFDVFLDQIKRTLEEEKPNHMSRFDFRLEDTYPEGFVKWATNEVNPINEVEMCYMMPILALPRFQ